MQHSSQWSNKKQPIDGRINVKMLKKKIPGNERCVPKARLNNRIHSHTTAHERKSTQMHTHYQHQNIRKIEVIGNCSTSTYRQFQKSAANTQCAENNKTQSRWTKPTERIDALHTDGKEATTTSDTGLQRITD